MGMSLILDGSAGVTYPVVAGSSSALQASAGKVLQVVSTTKTDTFSSASTTFIDITGMTVSITPTSASSQILVFLVSNCTVSITSAPQVFNLVRNSTAICQPSTSPTYFGTVTPYNQNADNSWGWSMLFLDSPATTSATTYKLQGRTGAGTFGVNRRSTADFASTSTITVMEIAA
jgi:hypothetical protein